MSKDRAEGQEKGKGAAAEEKGEDENRQEIPANPTWIRD
jgi:hypothetical protein